MSDVASVFDAFGIGIYCVDLGGRFTYVNPAGQALLGWSAEELLGRAVHETIHHSRPDGSPFPREECPLHRAFALGTTGQELDDVFWRRDGSPLEVVHSIAPLSEDAERVGTIAVLIDVRRRRVAELLRRRAAQQSALAGLGLLALGGGSLQALLDQALAVVAQTLDVELVEALELEPGAERLRLRAAVGLRPGLVGTATLEATAGSPAGLALARDEPVAVGDPRTERGLRPPPFLLDHGAVSGLTLVIHRRGRGRGTEPWGVLGAHARSPHSFTEEEVDFLRAVANTLGLAIERNEAAEELRQRNREVAELAEQVSKLADDRRRIMADALDAEDRAREQISQLLHDEVLQSLLTARQDLAKAPAGEGAAAEAVSHARELIVGAIRELRDAVVALHPVTLEQGGLVAALKAVADLHANRGGFEVTLHVEPPVGGLRDQLVVSLAQELLGDVARRAQARHVAMTLRRSRRGIVVEVVDDGRGAARARLGQTPDRGRVGLASIAMRVESLGGSFRLAPRRGGGTRALATIPVETPDPRAGGLPALHRRNG